MAHKWPPPLKRVEQARRWARAWKKVAKFHRESDKWASDGLENHWKRIQALETALKDSDSAAVDLFDRVQALEEALRKAADALGAGGYPVSAANARELVGETK